MSQQLSKIIIYTILFLGILTIRAQNFSLGILPDIQNMSETDADALNVKKMTQYYIDNKISLNMKMVVSVGDNVYGYSSDAVMNTEYGRIKPAFDNLKTAGLPYAPCVGNHDGQVSNQNYTFYNNWFPLSELKLQNPYLISNLNGSANTCYLFSASGMDFVMVVVETHDQFIISDKLLDYDQASIDWANSMFTTYSNRRGIFVSHDLFENSGYRLISDIVKKHDNIFLAFCGHTTTRIGFNGKTGREQYWTETTVGGNTANILLSDYQSDPDKGATDRYYTFKPLENKIYVYTYNVITKLFETDADSQFNFNYQMTGSVKTNLQHIETDEIKIFPNPAESTLYIEGDNILDLRVYNLDGSEINCICIKTNSFSLAIDSLAKGIYILKIKTLNGDVVKKFVKS